MADPPTWAMISPSKGPVTTIMDESFVAVTSAVRLPFVRCPFIMPLASIWTVALSDDSPSSDLSGIGSPTGATAVGVGAIMAAIPARAEAAVEPADDGAEKISKNQHGHEQ